MMRKRKLLLLELWGKSKLKTESRHNKMLGLMIDNRYQISRKIWKRRTKKIMMTLMRRLKEYWSRSNWRAGKTMMPWMS